MSNTQGNAVSQREAAQQESRPADTRAERMAPAMAPAPRRADSIRLGPWHQGAVYGATAALAITGIVWLALHYFFAIPGVYGPQIHPLEPWMLRLHGAAAMAGLVIYGSLLPVHIRRAWSIRRNIALGVALVAFMLALTLTGYLLYYAGGEETRPVISILHWVLGLVVPAVLAWHIVHGRGKTRQGDAHAVHLEKRE